MQSLGFPSMQGLEKQGLINLNRVYWNLTTPQLIEKIINRKEGELSSDGAVMVNTGKFTGRSPGDKYIVQNGTTEDAHIDWGKINQPISAEHFDRILQKLLAYYQNRDVFVQDLRTGAYPQYRLPIRVITEKAWHNLFARNLLIQIPKEELCEHKPEYTIIQAGSFLADPAADGVNSPTFIIMDLSRKLILIGGTEYAGEIKKSVFSLMNYLLPSQNVLPMHCSANVGKNRDVALFFGLSGTGKTTLSSDPERYLIGDDEHGWSKDGVFNFEGGCYAKTIKLSQKYEPIIWAATHRFGAVLENVVYNAESREIDFNDDSRTENTRGAYPLDFVPDHVESGYAGHPNHVFFLTADAFGVLPPVSRLTPEQAMYYFLSGYTAKLAGTEKGLGAEPQATFSACFGAPFLPLHPGVYAEMLGRKISDHKVSVWLINTGWSGGAYGTGKRIHLPYTRAMIRAALTNQFEKIPFAQEEHFGLWVPESCPDVPSDILLPRQTWVDPGAYDVQVRKLITLFTKNFAQFSQHVAPAVIASGPQLK